MSKSVKFKGVMMMKMRIFNGALFYHKCCKINEVFATRSRSKKADLNENEADENG